MQLLPAHPEERPLGVPLLGKSCLELGKADPGSVASGKDRLDNVRREQGQGIALALQAL